MVKKRSTRRFQAVGQLNSTAEQPPYHDVEDALEAPRVERPAAVVTADVAAQRGQQVAVRAEELVQRARCVAVQVAFEESKGLEPVSYFIGSRVESRRL